MSLTSDTVSRGQELVSKIVRSSLVVVVVVMVVVFFTVVVPLTAPVFTGRPPLVVAPVVVGEAVGEASGVAEGADVQLGPIEGEGEGSVGLRASLIRPVERITMSAIAPIIMVTIRPDTIDFMSYIILLTAKHVKNVLTLIYE